MSDVRLEQLRRVVDAILLAVADDVERRCAYIHLYGVAAEAAALALRRGLDPGLAAAAGMLHDIYAYRTGLGRLHAENSAEDGRVLLREAGYSVDDRLTVCDAIWHHSDKAAVHGPYAELLKDADVWQHYLYDVTAPVSPANADRLQALAAEQGLSLSFRRAARPPAKEAASSDRRARLAEIAGELAARPLCGDARQAGPDLAPLLRYFPRPDAAVGFDWCAAFVYHCCYLAGLVLPIRLPPSSAGTELQRVAIGADPGDDDSRLCAVAPWVALAKSPERNEFHPVDEVGFEPEPSDLVIYCGLLSAGARPCYDHIGVVLECQGDRLCTAEGNVDNRTGVFPRSRREYVAGYIRLEAGYGE